MKNKKKIVAAICVIAVIIISLTIGIVVSHKNKVKVEPEITTKIVESVTETTTQVPETTTEAPLEESTTEAESQPTEINKAPETTTKKNTSSNTTKPATPATTKPASPPATTPAPAPTQPATTAPTVTAWEWTDADLQNIVSQVKAYMRSKGYPLGGWNNTYYYLTQYNEIIGQEETIKFELSYSNPESSQYYQPSAMIELGWSKQYCINKIVGFLCDQSDDWGRQGRSVDCFYKKTGNSWKIYVVSE